MVNEEVKNDLYHLLDEEYKQVKTVDQKSG